MLKFCEIRRVSHTLFYVFTDAYSEESRVGPLWKKLIRLLNELTCLASMLTIRNTDGQLFW